MFPKSAQGSGPNPAVEMTPLQTVSLGPNKPFRLRANKRQCILDQGILLSVVDENGKSVLQLLKSARSESCILDKITNDIYQSCELNRLAVV